MVVGGENADDTAIKFGQMNEMIYSFVTVADKVINLQIKQLDIVPAFEPREQEIYFSTTLKLVPLVAIMTLTSLLWHGGFGYYNAKKQLKNNTVEQRKEDENARAEKQAA